MRPSPAVFGIAVVVLTSAACGDSGPTGPTTLPGHLHEVLEMLELHNANARRIDWTKLRADVAATAAGTTSIKEMYPAISVALDAMEDFESYYIGPDGVFLGVSPEPTCQRRISEIPSLPPTIAYVRVEGCPCQGPDADVYAETLQRAIQAADRPGLVGWIVDLRENGGGNIWPMIAGLGPLYGERIIGWIVYNNREYEREYRDGDARSFGDVFSSVAMPYTLIRPSPRIAVLTAETTNSAGEAITVFFKGRSDTRSFGAPTCGHHHLITEFRLRNRAFLGIKTAHNADQLKRAYAGPVTPDELAPEPGEAVARAVAWLLQGG